MGKHILALDQGTTSSRAIVFDETGVARGTAQKEFRQHFPQPGWVEHDAEEIWKTQFDCAMDALFKARVPAREIAAIGITNQRETTVLWDRATGKPVAPAIVWQDRRTAKRCENLVREGRQEMVRERTGLPIDAYFSASKISWLLDHTPGLRERADAGEIAFGTIDTWLIWKLSGGALHVTDPTNASRTLLYNIHTGDWDDTLCLAFNVPPTLLPLVVPSSGIVGNSRADVFGAEMPIGGIAGDQQAALFGQGARSKGAVKNTYGTGCFMLMNCGETPLASKNGLITTACASMSAGSKQYALEGSVFSGGSIVQWLRDSLGMIKSASEIEALAASVPDTGGVTLVPAFTGLGAPYWDSNVRAALTGMTRGTGRAHIARAALEAIAFQSTELALCMAADAGAALTELRVDGGAAANDLLMQLQADLLGVPVVRPRNLESTAWGAAQLAGLAAGVWQGDADLDALWVRERTFEPQAIEREARLAAWRQSVAQARGVAG
jgi:glycerol kinase